MAKLKENPQESKPKQTPLEVAVKGLSHSDYAHAVLQQDIINLNLTERDNTNGKH